MLSRGLVGAAWLALGACQLHSTSESIQSGSPSTPFRPIRDEDEWEEPGSQTGKTPVNTEREWPVPWKPQLDIHLRGLDRVAAAMVIGDVEEAAAAFAELSPPTYDSDSARYRMIGAILAERQQNWARSLELYDALAADRRAEKFIVSDILALARARVRRALAADVGVARAKTDAYLGEAAAILKKAISAKGGVRTRHRNFMMIERAVILALIRGQSRAEQKHAGTVAANELNKVIALYPNYPRLGELVLARADALERAGQIAAAATLLRKTAIDFAGSPFAAQAEREYKRLHEIEGRRVAALKFTLVEELERVRIARELRYVEWSRREIERLLSANKNPAIQAKLLDELAATAYRQRDYEGCIAASQGVLLPVRAGDEEGQGGEIPMPPENQDPEGHDTVTQEPGFESTIDEGSPRRCVERSGRVGVLLDQELARARQASRKGAKAAALWDALDTAFKGGHYQRALAVLTDYEKLSSGHASTRKWLRAWLAHRLGDRENAIAGFGALARNSNTLGRRARYFYGRLLLEDTSRRELGYKALVEVIEGHEFDYYGLWARQRIVDAGLPEPPLPKLLPPEDVERGLGFAQGKALLADVDSRFGAEIPSMHRAYLLFSVGLLDEARREIRISSEVVLALQNGGKRVMAPANEDWIVGSSWGAKWDVPEIAMNPALRKLARQRARMSTLDLDMRALAIAVHEPYRIARHGLDEGTSRYKRWYLRAYRDAVEREATKQKVWPTHLWALMYTESRFRRHVVSPVGARGALQIMPWTGRQLRARLGDTSDFFDPDELYDVDKNIELAAYYIKELIAKFHGQAPLAYASYNGGPSNVARWLAAKSGLHAFSSNDQRRPMDLDDFIEEMVFDESQRYTKRVMEVEAAYRWTYNGELTRWNAKLDPTCENNIDF
jgi:soluble lytic murein transglycosylase-like protein